MNTYRYRRHPIRTEPIEPVDPERLCEVCDDNAATQTGLLFQATRVDPAEWIDVCDECAT